MQNQTFRCKVSIGIIALFIIIFISYIIYINNEANTLANEINNEQFDNKNDLDNRECYKKLQYTEDSIKYPVMSPNIPADINQHTKIDYNGNDVIDECYENPTGKNNSCVKLIKPLLKYNGIFESKREFNNTDETQTWIYSNKRSNNSTYGSNKLLPPKNYPF